ncbi:hypothetical protein vBPaeSS2019XI_014 [Pseudomonas phage vB_Pae-SS2019XI]|uniref:Uncharacterized protein n=1 Tax=Pseudomonas phage vB_Pae-SS2019XI TaxID=2660688 RepID=A0A6G6XGM9_9CAUD|nr:hypothetical protein JT355_gp14 [Pseudomonas phage vB_Pae-SS2019XI]QIG56892.1 hypothetical protein vBPaeSS2019XI_014 [Pseudomonas phage vB_Pae-SS2019XI]
MLGDTPSRFCGRKRGSFGNGTTPGQYKMPQSWKR